jgi:hypothetical protein
LLRSAIETVEAATDGLVGPKAVAAVNKKAEAACHSAELDSPEHFLALAALRMTGDERTVTHYAYHVPFFLQGALAATRGQEALSELQRAQAGLLRDVVGNPYRAANRLRRTHAWGRKPLAVRSSWLAGDVLALCQAAYAERELPSGHLCSERLAVLSDALEEAGCSEEAILSHLRSPGPHVRGCWVLDLILDKQ